jgi:neutral ceramidase
MKKTLRIAKRILLVLALLALTVAVFCLRFLDASPYTENGFYKTMMQRLDSLPQSPMDSVWSDDKGLDYWTVQHKPTIDAAHPLSMGWSKVNITPPFAVPTAGYGNRKGQPIGVVHDSLYVRAFVFDNNGAKSAIVSCDLLIIPPEVTLQVKKDLATIGWSWQQIFIGATHTHNSMGAWGKRAIGELFAGKYDQNVVDLISKSIVEAIKKAQQNVEPVTYSYKKTGAPQYVMNRLVKNYGTKDPYIRMLVFKQQNSQKQAALVTYAAHSTTLSDTVMQLSRDYNGILVDKLEREQGFDQAVFMAGCVGSMGPDEPEKLNDWQQADYIANGLAGKIDTGLKDAGWGRITNFRLETIPLSMREPQWRIAPYVCMRHWIWSSLYGDYDSEVKALLIDNVLIVGLPCDFSGELMASLEFYASSHRLNLMITSFNGGYVGYITDDKHYDLDKYETRTMNWFGPGNGAYFSDVVKRLVDKM